MEEATSRWSSCSLRGWHRYGQLPRNEIGVHKTSESLTIVVGKSPSVVHSSSGDSILFDVWFKRDNWESGGFRKLCIGLRPTASIMNDVVLRPSLERI